jgi:hypothetical protein
MSSIFCGVLFIVGDLSLLQIVSANSGSYQPNGDVRDSISLVVDVVERPVDCKRTSKNGNTLKIHFTGYFKNGTEFDNR